MKRFFGFFILMVAFVLASCGINDVPKEKASVDFSIPVADILAYHNRASRDAGDTTTGTDPQTEEQKLLKILVQLYNSEDYHEYQLQTIDFVQLEKEYEEKLAELEAKAEQMEQMADGFQDEMLALYAKYGINITDLDNPTDTQEQQMLALYSNSAFQVEYKAIMQKYGMGNVADTVFGMNYSEDNPPSEDDIDQMLDQIYESMGLNELMTLGPYGILDQKLDFSFKDLELGDYTVTVDVFAGDTDNQDEVLEFNWVMTGEKSTQIVAGNNIVTVQLTMPDYSSPTYERPVFFEVEFSYALGERIVTKTVPLSDFIGDEVYSVDEEDFKWIEPKYELVNLNGLPSFRVRENSTPGEDEDDVWHAFESFDYVLKDNNHFSTGFELKGTIDDEPKENPETGEDEKTIYPVNFKNGRASLLNRIEHVEYSDYMFVEVSKKFGADSLCFGFTEVSIPACPIVDFGSSTTIEEEFAEIVMEQTALPFTQSLEYSPSPDVYRYIAGVDLSEVLGDKKLSAGDTAVFMLTPAQSDQSLAQTNVTKFYYQLEDWTEEHKIDFDKLNFITLSDYSVIVMPINSIPADNANTLVLYFDTATDATELTIDCSISCHIFPAKDDVYVFNVGSNAGTLRYEINPPVRDSEGRALSLSENDTVTVAMSGSVSYVKLGDDGMIQSEPADITLTGELYDGALYSNSYFHPLSKDYISTEVENTDNVKQIEIVEGDFTGNGEFVFAHIQAPHVEDSGDFVNKFLLQCITTCEDPNLLLVIRGFNMNTMVESAQGSSGSPDGTVEDLD